MPSRSYTKLAFLALIAGVATVPGADAFVPQKLSLARGELLIIIYSRRQIISWRQDWKTKIPP